MTTVTVDGQSIAAAEVSGDNLEEMLISLMEHPLAANKLITEVRLNGSPYNEEVPHAALEVTRETIAQLDLSTCTAEDLSLHFLANGSHFIGRLTAALPKIIDNFRLGDEMEANEHFLRFLESLHLLINMLDQTRRALGLGDDPTVPGAGALNGYLITLSEALSRILKLQEDNDWIFLADLLEYEVGPALADLGSVLPQLTKAGH